MSISISPSPRLVAIISSLMLVASLAVPFATASAALGDKCDNAYIMHCGFSTKSDWQNNYNKGDGTNSATNLQQIYSSQGVTPATVMSSDTVEGFVTKDSKVVVGGKVVATNVWSSGRSSLGFDNAVNMGNGVWFHPTGVTFAAGVTQIPALVNMKGGSFQFALMKSCGNIVKPINKPFGLLNKEVKDITTGSALAAADTSATALNVNDGDTVQYNVVVANNGTADMVNTVTTDALPAGVTLVSKPSMRTITDPTGTVAAGTSKLITITVKVNASSNGQIIDNKACFTANGGQKGCDHAVIKVTKKVTPTPTPTPTPPPTAPSVVFECTQLSANVGSDNVVHFGAQAHVVNTAIQRYIITLSNGEQVVVVSTSNMVGADKAGLAPGNYSAVLQVQTGAGMTPEVDVCKASFTIAAPPVGGGTVPEIPDTGASALGGMLGLGGLGYATRGYLRSRRNLIESIKNR